MQIVYVVWYFCYITGDRLNIEMSSCKYRDIHGKDTPVSWPAYLYLYGIHYIWEKDGETGLQSSLPLPVGICGEIMEMLLPSNL